MFRKNIYNLYKRIGLTDGEISAEISMIIDFLGIEPMKELKVGYSEEEKSKILSFVQKRVDTGMPLQYILGFGYFMGEKFFVDKNTLIPRPETEILVRECANLANKTGNILDIGTGSGCIAIELSKHTGANVCGVDISADAIKIAKKNAKFHNVRCDFYVSDLFSNIKGTYDIIVSNPPYIPLKDMNMLENHVINFEPHAALFAKDEFGIEFYIKIIEQSLTFLNKNGYLCFEVGKAQSGKIIKVLQVKGFTEINTVKDLDNIERVIIAKFCKKNFAI